MLYVQRDGDGAIIAIFNAPNEQARESILPHSNELNHFLQSSADPASAQAFLESSDRELVRVLEDLIELLVEKKLVMVTELPAIARQKLLFRKQARDSANPGSTILVDGDIPF
jgi:hypothetical protein